MAADVLIWDTPVLTLLFRHEASALWTEICHWPETNNSIERIPPRVDTEVEIPQSLFPICSSNQIGIKSYSDRPLTSASQSERYFSIQNDVCVRSWDRESHVRGCHPTSIKAAEGSVRVSAVQYSTIQWTHIELYEANFQLNSQSARFSVRT